MLMWLDLVTNLTPFYKLVLTLVISHCFGLPSLSRAGPQVGHRLGPQPHFLRAAQGHQAPARVFRGVEKRPSVGFSGGNVQTNGRNIVNMTPPGPGVSTRGLGLNSAITGGNNNNQGNNNNVNQGNNNNNAANLNSIANTNAVLNSNTNNANVVNIQPPG